MKTALRYVPLLLLALAWEAVVRLGWVSEDLLPPLTRVLAAGWQLADLCERVIRSACER